ncbi:protein of unknown function [Pseudobutyrivibrio sp. YE44]|uniref:zinc ribbon domain-containing protein n=1 Tax=Pseudobutyrivibrio sp. YE44 TaxID=1520802 RepID=UPI0008861581|nr:zinc ribbon domain-containing protein [Pseudobutyrivibrio sp. YE44]SDB10268.1 protein of unknown function [Pseudobutyrivibrio sp. YE44]
MFCTNCGAEIAPGNKFCENCGQPVEQEAPKPVEANNSAPVAPTPAPTPAPAPMPAPQQAPVAGNTAASNKGSNKTLVIIIVAAIIALVLILAVGGFAFKKIKDSKLGKANETTETTEEVADSKDSEEETEEDDSLKEGFLTSYSQVTEDEYKAFEEICFDSFASQLADDEEYADGELISKAEFAGYIFHANDTEQGVKGNDLLLVYSETVSIYGSERERLKVGAFSNLERVNGELQWGDMGYGSDFSGARDGDSAINMFLTCVRRDENRDGSNDSQYECGGIFEKYIGCQRLRDYSEITDENRDVFKEVAEWGIQYYLPGNDTSLIIEDINYEGDIFNVYHDDNFTLPDEYYLVYTASVSTTGGGLDHQKVYIPVMFGNLYKLTDGSCDCSDFNYFGNFAGDYYFGYGVCFGYGDDEEMYRGVVSENRNSYDSYLSDTMQEIEDKYKVY